MAIDAAEVRRIARLAYLELPRVQGDAGEWVEPAEQLIDDARLERFADELSKILDYVAELSTLDLDDVEATSHGVPLPTRFRDDSLGEPLATERALDAAPQTAGDAFAVPKIIE